MRGCRFSYRGRVRGIVWCLMVILLPALGQATPQCLPHPSVIELHARLTEAVRVRDWLMSRGQDTLRAATQEMRKQRQMARRSSQALKAFPPEVAELIEASLLMQSSPGMRDYLVAVDYLTAFESAMAAACAISPDDVPSVLAVARTGDPGSGNASAQEVRSFTDGGPATQLWSSNVVTRIGLLAAGLSLALLGLLMLKRGYDIAFALIYNRRSCQIPAVLYVGNTRFDGRISILGRLGCRFVLTDPTDTPELRAVAETADTHLRLGPYVAPAHILVLEQDTAGIHFEVPIKLSLQQKFLKLSVTAPQVLTKRKRLVPEIPQYEGDRPPRAAFVDDRRSGV